MLAPEENFAGGSAYISLPIRLDHHSLPVLFFATLFSAPSAYFHMYKPQTNLVNVYTAHFIEECPAP